ncbi:hypothetical protein ILUMI_10194 [Ignelater luminosus]|uniref:Uncharacterized protein n=1 Tax=Ignelater luminosus TaxID=2038154 RepID=A0A8K0GED2_IGNLU|nr:hypothetical protein ILUMI_10194 [Ignelater luminosus]
MFKYNTSPMQPLTEESESFSDAQTATSNRPIHELSGQDAAIIARIKRIREIMETLRLRLSVEKDNLARERLEAATLFMYHPVPVNRDYFFSFPGFYGVPVPYNYNFMEPAWRPAGSIQEYERLVGSYNYTSPLNMYNHNLRTKPHSLINAAEPNSYKEQLQDVEKMCQEEFNKMQESISSLRKMKLQTKDPSSDEDISNFPDYVFTNKRRHRKHDRSSHRKQQKIHHRDHSKLRQPNYILADDTTTLDEHRNHYYQHYNRAPQKRRYLNSPVAFKGESIEEYSGDTTETSSPLWHLDSPYESDYDVY